MLRMTLLRRARGLLLLPLGLMLGDALLLRLRDGGGDGSGSVGSRV